VSRFSASRIIATAAAHSALKPWAVKLHAYTLDSSIKCASALQQKQVFPQLLGIALFLGRWHDKGCAPAKPARPENNLELPFIESPSLSQPGADFAPAREVPSNIARSAARP
jgi:hypothetical protein